MQTVIDYGLETEWWGYVPKKGGEQKPLQIAFAELRCDIRAVERRPLETALSIAFRSDGFMKQQCLQIAK